MAELRPIIKNVEQSTLDIYRVFKLLFYKNDGQGNLVKDKDGLGNKIFTEYGQGVFSSTASLSPDVAVVFEKELIEEQSKVKKFKNAVKDYKKSTNDLVNELEELKKKNDRLLFLLNKVKNKKPWWKF